MTPKEIAEQFIQESLSVGYSKGCALADAYLDLLAKCERMDDLINELRKYKCRMAFNEQDREAHLIRALEEYEFGPKALKDGEG
jgi:hypothetical protein